MGAGPGHGEEGGGHGGEGEGRRGATLPVAVMLQLRAQGATLEDIAQQTGVQRGRIGRLLRQGMSELGARTQAELIAVLSGRVAAGRLPPSLTSAERDVVLQVIAGASNREIAERRGTSSRTVANQLQAIYGKLGIGSRRELVARVVV